MRAQAGWGLADVPDQRGRTAVITGGNSGLGYETAAVLAERGATVVLACRDLTKAEQAAARIRKGAPDADVRIEELDLLSPASVQAAAGRLRAAHPRLDLLINNAGLMRPPRDLSAAAAVAAGIEPTFYVNHLGHFALTGLLLDRLLASPGSRIVTVSSLVHLVGRADLEGLARLPAPRVSPEAPRSAGPGGRLPSRPRLYYPRSKLANLMFTFELHRRLAAAGAPTLAVAAHPGIARTGLTRNLAPPARVFLGVRAAPVMSWLIQSPQMGALATLRAATDTTARGGDYYGPSGWFGSTGLPAAARSSSRARDAEQQRRLWRESERLSGVAYDFGVGPGAGAGGAQAPAPVTAPGTRHPARNRPAEPGAGPAYWEMADHGGPDSGGL